MGSPLAQVFGHEHGPGLAQDGVLGGTIRGATGMGSRGWASSMCCTISAMCWLVRMMPMASAFRSCQKGSSIPLMVVSLPTTRILGRWFLLSPRMPAEASHHVLDHHGWLPTPTLADKQSPATKEEPHEVRGVYGGQAWGLAPWRREGTGCGGRGGARGEDPAGPASRSLSLSPLPLAFLLSPFLSGVKLVPPLLIQNSLANLLLLRPWLLPISCPQGLTLSTQPAYQCISLSKDPKRNCSQAVK